MSYQQAAFEAICKEATQAKGHYITLMESCPYYGGPEEGGWWGADNIIVAYQQFPTREQAEAALDKIQKLAEELTKESHIEFGEHCLREMEWLDARGLDADFLPEPDGESQFYVILSDGLPEQTYGDRHYS